MTPGTRRVACGAPATDMAITAVRTVAFGGGSRRLMRNGMRLLRAVGTLRRDATEK